MKDIRIKLFVVACIVVLYSCREVREDYFETGELKSKYEVNSEGVPDGFIKMYYKTGELMTEGIMNNGRFEGPATGYYPSGEIQWKGTFKDYKKHGRFKYYSEDGSLIKEENFKEDSLHGVYKAYYETGNIRTIQNLTNGKPDGWIEFYYPSGKIEEKQLYKDGEQIYYISYTEEGEVTEEWVKPVLVISQDTLSLGKEIKGTIELNEPLKGEDFMFMTFIHHETDRSHNRSKTYYSENGTIEFNYKPEIPGKYSFIAKAIKDDVDLKMYNKDFIVIDKPKRRKNKKLC